MATPGLGSCALGRASVASRSSLYSVRSRLSGGAGRGDVGESDGGHSHCVGARAPLAFVSHQAHVEAEERRTTSSRAGGTLKLIGSMRPGVPRGAFVGNQILPKTK